ncbi:fibrinogen alpha-2 chain-like isoform X2 [Dreissena polymorpha]|uniref:fibrinogen alpha-2 chain-like isoform X2 n=1 Tax=Dreissena polymorpha TaxID=45954 RepID=UPI002264E743|nr:fibrinogen alpha-2 chain-like isoform X2 [Dreissena polymorpha]
MDLVILVVWLFLCFDSATGAHCLSCTSMPSSVPCVTSTTCSTGQECYAKYLLKPNGTVTYEFGCQDSKTCPGHSGTHALIGKRATGDVELCYKCCQGDMCNQGSICTGSSTSVRPMVVPTTVTVSVTTLSTTAQTTLTTSGGDICLSCTDSPLTRECLYTVNCGSHESCYADAFDNPNGDTVFNMGCRDRQVVNRSNGNTLLCAKCCLGNLCNAALCGQTGLPSVGPVCFNCDQASTPSSCNTIAQCGRDEVCHLEKTLSSLTHATLYKSGCLLKTHCDRLAQSLTLIGRRRYDKTVITGNDLQLQCCDSNVCNHGKVSSASSTTLTTAAVTPTHNSILSHQGACTRGPCVHGQCFENSTDYVCQCENGWTGKNCDNSTSTTIATSSTTSTTTTSTTSTRPTTTTKLTVPGDCLELRAITRVSGVYNIRPAGMFQTIDVYCDMATDGGGWTVFQRRVNGSVDFYQNFSLYENGFGDVHGEHWLGLKYVHAMTSKAQTELRVDLMAAEGSTVYEVFPNFRLSASPDYRLHVDKGNGTAGDDYGLSYHNGNSFSTYDHDGDHDCAKQCHGGRWYNDCAFVNFNGRYVTPGTADTSCAHAGISYYNFKQGASMAETKMMFRRV